MNGSIQQAHENSEGLVGIQVFGNKLIKRIIADQE
jgi:hypothetical protein